MEGNQLPYYIDPDPTLAEVTAARARNSAKQRAASLAFAAPTTRGGRRTGKKGARRRRGGNDGELKDPKREQRTRKRTKANELEAKKKTPLPIDDNDNDSNDSDDSDNDKEEVVKQVSLPRPPPSTSKTNNSGGRKKKPVTVEAAVTTTVESSSVSSSAPRRRSEGKKEKDIAEMAQVEMLVTNPIAKRTRAHLPPPPKPKIVNTPQPKQKQQRAPRQHPLSTLTMSPMITSTDSIGVDVDPKGQKEPIIMAAKAIDSAIQFHSSDSPLQQSMSSPLTDIPPNLHIEMGLSNGVHNHNGMSHIHDNTNGTASMMSSPTPPFSAMLPMIPSNAVVNTMMYNMMHPGNGFIQPSSSLPSSSSSSFFPTLPLPSSSAIATSTTAYANVVAAAAAANAMNVGMNGKTVNPSLVSINRSSPLSSFRSSPTLSMSSVREDAPVVGHFVDAATTSSPVLSLVNNGIFSMPTTLPPSSSSSSFSPPPIASSAAASSLVVDQPPITTAAIDTVVATAASVIPMLSSMAAPLQLSSISPQPPNASSPENLARHNYRPPIPIATTS
jgi:hypothetical protein